MQLRAPFGLACACAGALLLGATGPVCADTVTLNNGGELHGRLIDESRDEIRVRTANGVISIPKAMIATFTEDENWGDYGARPRRQHKNAQPKPRPKDEGDEAGGGGSGSNGGGPEDEGKQPEGPLADLLANWTWPKDLSEDEVRELTSVRDKIVARLEELGPSEKERLAALELTGEEKNFLRSRLQVFRRHGRAGSSGLRRNNAKKEIVRKFGVRALPELVRALDDDNAWVLRLSCQAIAEIVAAAKEPADATWLVWHLRVPEKLVDLLEHEGELHSGFVRAEANAALEKLLKKRFGFRPSNESLSTPAETAARKKWRAYVQKQRAAWEREQKQKEAQRTALRDALDALRKGQAPDPKELEEMGIGG